MSGNENSSDNGLVRDDYPYFTEDEFKDFRGEDRAFVNKMHSKYKKRYETRIAQYSLDHDESRNLEMNLNIVICGKAGSGKSTTANTILGRKVFTASSSSNSVTQVSLDNKCTYRNRKITVVDTPGVHATNSDITTIKKELARMAFLLSDGVHCFIICMSASESRFTKDVENMLELIKPGGEGKFYDYCMLAYTKAETELETCTLRAFLEQKEENKHNCRLLRSINNRVVAVNNKCSVPAEALRNRDALINMADVVVAENIRNGNPVLFTNDLFKAAGSLQKKLTSVVKENRFDQAMVSATIEVVIKNASSWDLSSVSSEKFLEEVITILKERNESEKTKIIPDLLITETGNVKAKYVNQIKQIYDKIQPELSKFWLKIAAGGAVAAVAAVAVFGIISLVA